MTAGRLTLTVTSYPTGGAVVEWPETLDDALARGRDYAAMYLGNDPARSHVRVKVSRSCVLCEGDGRARVRRGRNYYVTVDPCKACVGSGDAEILADLKINRGPHENG